MVHMTTSLIHWPGHPGRHRDTGRDGPGMRRIGAAMRAGKP
jgi:hypothetical protein